MSLAVLPTGLHRFSVKEYHHLISAGVLDNDDRVELLEGHIVEKMPHDPIHDAVIQLVDEKLREVLPEGWRVRIQSALTTSDSEPEPDLVVHRGLPRDFLHRHPGPQDVALIVEVANTSLQRDRGWKGRINARAGVGEYWIINTTEGIVERYTTPSIGADGLPCYRDREDLCVNATVTPPVPGATSIAVRDILP